MGAVRRGLQKSITWFEETIIVPITYKLYAHGTIAIRRAKKATPL